MRWTIAIAALLLTGCTIESPTQVIIIDGSCNTEVVTAVTKDAKPGTNNQDDIPICENN